MKISISRKDVIWNYIGYFFTLLTNIIILPFVMKMVNQGELGLWYTFLSIAQLAYIFDNTFAGCISRSFTFAWSGVSKLEPEGFGNIQNCDEINYKLFITILKTSRAIYARVSIIVLIALCSLGTFYINRVAFEINNTVWIISWIIFVVAIFVNLFFSYWITALRGIGDFTQAQQANVLSKLIQIVVSLVGLYNGYGLIALTLAYLLSGCALRIYGKRSLMKHSKLKFYYQKYYAEINKEEIKNNFTAIWFNAKKSAAVCISSYIITQSTTLICSGFLGLNETASYGLALQIITAIAGISMIYFNTMKPKLTEYKLHAKEDERLFVKKMSATIVVYWLVYLLSMIALIFAGLPIIEIWKSNTELPLKMILLMGFYLFLENNHSLFASIIEMSNKIPYVKAGIITSIFIVTGEFLIVKFSTLGIYGLMYVQCVIQLCYNNWKWPSVILKEYRINLFDILKIGTKEAIQEIKDIIK